MTTPQNDNFVHSWLGDNLCHWQRLSHTTTSTNESSIACPNAMDYLLQSSDISLLHLDLQLSCFLTSALSNDMYKEVLETFQHHSHIIKTTRMLWTDAPKWKDVVRKIWKFRELEEGWDSYGGERIGSLTCYNAVELMKTWYREAEKLGGELSAPIVSPCGNGSIQMDWRLGQKSIELEATAEEETPYRWYSPSHDEEGDFAEPYEEESIGLLRWLITQK